MSTSRCVSEQIKALESVSSLLPALYFLSARIQSAVNIVRMSTVYFDHKMTCPSDPKLRGIPFRAIGSRTRPQTAHERAMAQANSVSNARRDEPSDIEKEKGSPANSFWGDKYESDKGGEEAGVLKGANQDIEEDDPFTGINWERWDRELRAMSRPRRIPRRLTVGSSAERVSFVRSSGRKGELVQANYL